MLFHLFMVQQPILEERQVKNFQWLILLLLDQMQGFQKLEFCMLMHLKMLLLGSRIL